MGLKDDLINAKVKAAKADWALASIKSSFNPIIIFRIFVFVFRQFFLKLLYNLY